MFIQAVTSKGKKGQIYESILVCSSRRVGKKVITKTLAVLTHLPKPLISLIENAIKRKFPPHPSPANRQKAR